MTSLSCSALLSQSVIASLVGGSCHCIRLCQSNAIHGGVRNFCRPARLHVLRCTLADGQYDL